MRASNIERERVSPKRSVSTTATPKLAALNSVSKPSSDVSRDHKERVKPALSLQDAKSCKARPKSSAKKAGGSGREFVPWCR